MISGVNSIQSFLFVELQLQVDAEPIQQFYNSIIQPLDGECNFNSVLPSKLVDFLDYILQEPYEKYTSQVKNNQLVNKIKSFERSSLDRDTLFEILFASNVSERNDSSASNSSNGCLKLIISDGVCAYTAIEVSKIPNIPTDLKQVRNKKILIRKNTKIQFNMLFINSMSAQIVQNSQHLITLKKQKPLEHNQMYLNTTTGVMPAALQEDSQFFSHQTNNNPTLNANILSLIDQDDDDDDDDDDVDEELELQNN